MTKEKEFEEWIEEWKKTHLVQPFREWGLMKEAYLAALIPVFSRRTTLLGLRAEFLLDFSFLLAGIVLLAWLGL